MVVILTGSFLKKTKEERVSMNQRFFQDVQPNPIEIKKIPKKKTLNALCHPNSTGN